MKIIPDTLTITDAGKPRELFMSFGLLDELLKIIGDIPAISAIAIEPDLRFRVLNSVLAERNDVGIVTQPITLFTLRVAQEDIHLICSWVAEHALDFFLTAIERNLNVHLKHQSRLTASTPSGSGSQI